MAEWEISWPKVGFWMLVLAIMLLWTADIHPINSAAELIIGALKGFTNFLAAPFHGLGKTAMPSRAYGGGDSDSLFAVAKLGLVLLAILGFVRLLMWGRR